MKKLKELKKVRVFRDSDGAVTGSKGTTCNLMQDGAKQYVEKQWVSGDWVFSADYEYEVAKHIYQTSSALGLPVPKLLGFKDAERKLLIEYIPGAILGTPASDDKHLLPVLRFFDAFRGITFPTSLWVWKMNEEKIHKYRLDQLQYLFPKEEVWTQIDSIYEAFLREIPYNTIPFDGILKNTILRDGKLCFFDFEWTIKGPYEFTLARIAIEFNQYDPPQIVARVGQTELYHLFLLRFYMYGREPKSVSRYLKKNLVHQQLRILFDIVNAQKYAGAEWCST